MKQRRAFTLIELLVALVILAAVSALAIPAYTAAQQQAQQKAYWAQAQSLAAAVSSYYAVNGCYPPSLANGGSGMPAGLGPYVGGPWPSGYAYWAWLQGTVATTDGAQLNGVLIVAGSLPGGWTDTNGVWVLNGQTAYTC